MVFLVISYLGSKEFKAQIDESNPFLYLVPIVAVAGYFGSQLIFRNQVSAIKKTMPLEEKLKRYQSASIVKYALLEGPALLAIVAYNTSGNALPLVIAVCLVLYLAVQRPNLQKLLDALPLTPDEIRNLQYNQ